MVGEKDWCQGGVGGEGCWIEGSRAVMGGDVFELRVLTGVGFLDNCLFG